MSCPVARSTRKISVSGTTELSAELSTRKIGVAPTDLAHATASSNAKAAMAGRQRTTPMRCDGLRSVPGRSLGRQLPSSVGIISERIAMASKQEVFLTGDAELSTGVQYGASISLGDTSEIERSYGPAKDGAASCATALSPHCQLEC